MGHFLSTLAGVPLGDVLVNNIQAVNISGNDCLTVSLWITGVDGMCRCTHMHVLCSIYRGGGAVGARNGHKRRFK